MPLSRHQLVRLAPEAWPALIATAEDGVAHTGLAHWASHSLPLVVARQATGATPSAHTLGIPLPTCWGRRRLSVAAWPHQVLEAPAFPPLRALASQFGNLKSGAWSGLADGLESLGVHTLVYGSYGWQAVTGMDYLRTGSDLDLLMPIPDAGAADAACSLLGGFSAPAPRLDGELVFPDGTGVAWREWVSWRSGQQAQILLKRIDRVCLAEGPQWLADATAQEASA